jgi:hypothetical protein
MQCPQFTNRRKRETRRTGDAAYAPIVRPLAVRSEFVTGRPACSKLQRAMKDLTDPRWIKLKGVLFLIIGMASAVMLILEQRSLKAGVLLAISIWCFCRFYYFAFYVIEHYVDPGFKFSGLWSFAVYLRSGRKKDRRSADNAD